MTPDRKPHRLLTAIKWLVILLLAILLALAVFVSTFDVNQYKPRIESLVGEALGRKVELRGDIYTATSLIPTVVARGIHIANTGWAKMDDFAIVDRLSFNIALFPLILEKRLVIDGIELDGVRINLEKNKAGDNNWTLGKQHADPEVGGLSAIRAVEVENLDIVYRSPHGDEHTINIVKAYADFHNGLQSLEMTGSYLDEIVVASLQRNVDTSSDDSLHKYLYQTELEYRDAMISANAGLALQDALAIDIADIKLQIKDKQQVPLQVISGHLSWGMEDSLALSLKATYSDIPVVVTGSAGSIRTMFDAIEFPVKVSLTSNENIVEVEGELSEKLTNPDIKIQSARINNTDFKGRLIFDRSESSLIIRGQLKSSKFSLDDIERLPIFGIDHETDNKARQFKLPENIGLDLELKVNDIDGLAVDVSAMQGKISLRQGLLKISNVKLNALSGVVTGGVELANSARGVDYTLNLKGRQVDVQKLLRGHKIHGQTVSGAIQNMTLDMKGPMVGADQLISQSRIDLQLGESQLTLQGAGKSGKEPLQLDKLKLVSIPGQSVQATLQGQLRGSPFGLDLQTADYDALRQSSAFLPVKFTATYAGHNLQAEGKMGDMQVGKGLHVSLDLKGDNLQTLGPFFKVELPETGAYELTGRLDATDDDYNITDIKGKLGKSVVMGAMRVSTVLQRPSITANLNSKAFHYHNVFAQQERKGEDDGRLVPDAEIPVEFLKSFDAVIDIKAEKFFIGEVEYQDFIFHADLKDGLLKIEPFDSRLAGAFVDGALHVDARQQKPTTQFTLNSKNTDYGGLLESFGWTDKVEGLGDVEINLQGSGTMIRETLANSTGYIQLVAGEGTIKEPRFDLWAAGLVNTMLTSAWDTKEVASVQCIVGRFDIKDGMVTSDTLML
ncbi:MAG: AsmA family protein, partial [Gammaproteobacteria bacterium]|nr:AsmA family protein [Gammaproteobacteria bacterium]